MRHSRGKFQGCRGGVGMGAQGWVCATYTKLQGKSAGPCPKIRGQHTLEGLCSPTQRQQRPAYKVSISWSKPLPTHGHILCKKSNSNLYQTRSLGHHRLVGSGPPAAPGRLAPYRPPEQGWAWPGSQNCRGACHVRQKILATRCTHTHALLRACLQQPRPGLPAYSNGARCGQPLRRLVALAVYSSLRNTRRKMPHSKSSTTTPMHAQ